MNGAQKVWSYKAEIISARNEEMKRLIEKYDKEVFNDQVKKLRDLCFKETGHNFKFDRYDLNGNAIHSCMFCNEEKTYFRESFVNNNLQKGL